VKVAVFQQVVEVVDGLNRDQCLHLSHHATDPFLRKVAEYKVRHTAMEWQEIVTLVEVKGVGSSTTYLRSMVEVQGGEESGVRPPIESDRYAGPVAFPKRANMVHQVSTPSGRIRQQATFNRISREED
jgi:hypothetical protein